MFGVVQSPSLSPQLAERRHQPSQPSTYRRHASTHIQDTTTFQNQTSNQTNNSTNNHSQWPTRLRNSLTTSPRARTPRRRRSSASSPSRRAVSTPSSLPTRRTPAPPCPRTLTPRRRAPRRSVEPRLKLSTNREDVSI